MAEENSDFNISDFNQKLEEWAQNTAEQFVLAIKKYKSVKTNTLLNSIAKQLIKHNGDVNKVLFRYQAYGRFVDMGTGREFARGNRSTEAFAKYRNQNGSLKKRPKRKPKPWYSKTAYREIKYLSESLLADLQQNVLSTMAARVRRINKHINSKN